MKVPADVRRGNSPNKISAGEVANRRPEGLAVFVLPRVPDALKEENHELSFGLSRPDNAAAMKPRLHIIQHFDLKKGIITFAEIEVTETPDNIYFQLTERVSRKCHNMSFWNGSRLY